jgi:hypothetical protein
VIGPGDDPRGRRRALRADAEARLGFAYLNGSIRYADDRADNVALALRDCLKA